MYVFLAFNHRTTRVWLNHFQAAKEDSSVVGWSSVANNNGALCEKTSPLMLTAKSYLVKEDD